MGSVTSEKTLSALERSKSEPLELVDDAAKIAGLDLHLSSTAIGEQHRKVTESDQPGFREQWLLKWLLRKLSETVENAGKARELSSLTDAGRQFLLTDRTWTLLLHLFEKISRNALLEILLERNFFRVFSHWLGVVLSHLQSLEADQPSSAISINVDGDGPRKRRKLSSGVDESKSVAPELSTRSTLYSLTLTVTSRSAGLLQGQASAASSGYRHASPVWASSAAEAALLVGNILQLVKNSLPGILDTSELDEHFEAVNLWLSLWHNRSGSGNENSKDEAHKQFTRSCLHPSIQILTSLKVTSSNSDYVRTSKNSIEKQIAFNIILPMRSLFNERVAGDWKRPKDVLIWDDIEPSYEIVKSYIAEAYDEDTMAQETHAFEKKEMATTLLDIAARLISPNDIRRKQWEQPWFEALTLALMYCAFPGQIPKMTKNDDGILVMLQKAHPTHQTSFLGSLFDVLNKHGIELSLPALSYITSALLAEGQSQINSSTIAAIVNMNVNVFLPNLGTANSSSCLQLLCGHIRTSSDFAASDRISLLSTIITPLMQGFAKTRDLDGFVQLWLQELELELMAANDNFTDSSVQPEVIWDHRAVHQEFERLCHLHATPNFGQTLLKSTTQSVESLSSAPELDAGVSARVVVLQTTLEARGVQLIEVSENKSLLDRLTDVLIDALKNEDDLRIPRWRLWSFLCTLTELDSLFDRSTNLNENFPIAKSFKQTRKVNSSKKKHHKSLLFMESYQHFCMIVASRSSGSESVTASFEVALGQLNKNLAVLMEDLGLQELKRMAIWNGLPNSMETSCELVSACLVQLLQSSEVLDHTSTALSELLSHLCRIILVDDLSNDDESGSSTFGDLSNAFLTTYAIYGHENLFQVYVDAIEAIPADQKLLLRIPPVLLAWPIESVKKSQASTLGDIICKHVQEYYETASNQANVSCIVFLTRLVQTHAVSIGLPENFHYLVEWTEKIVRTGDIATEALIRRSIEDVFHSVWQRILDGAKATKRGQYVSKIWKWCNDVLHIKRSKKVPPNLLVLVHAAHASFSLNKDIIAENIQQSDVEDLGPRLVEQVLHNLREIIEDEVTPSSIVRLSSVLDMLRHTGVEPVVITKVVEHVSKSGQQGNGQAWLSKAAACLSEHEYEHVAVSFALRNILSSPLKTLLFGAASVSLKDEDFGVRTSNGRIEMLAREACDYLHAPKNKRDVHLQTLSTSKEENAWSLKSHFANAAKILNLQESTLRNMPDLAGELDKLTTMSQTIHLTTPQSLALALETSQMILELHPSTVNQSTVDSVLRSIIFLTSSSSPPQTQPKTTDDTAATVGINAAVFQHLSSIVSTLLSRYRRRLTGRFHLLIPALQNLTRCLFYSPAHTHQTTNPVLAKQRAHFLTSLPTWLTGSQNDFPALPSSAAAGISRIFSSLCNPTASLARSANKKRKNTLDLNDETKRARRVAAQYVQYVLMTYCQCVLEGQMQPDARDRLVPGLYTVLDAMDRELMRAMNAAMDPSARAIFKGLYDDWVRWGRWDQS